MGLVQLIAALLDKRSRYSLIQVCQYFHTIVLPMLYEQLEINTLRDRAHAPRIFKTLARRPELAQAVIKFHGYIRPLWMASYDTRERCDIKPPWDWWKDVKARKAKAAHLENVAVAFRNARNIRSLHIHDCDGPTGNGPYLTLAPILAQMHLRELEVGQPFWPYRLIPALRPHVHLTHLDLSDGHFGVTDITPADIPNLTHLSCELRLVQWLVPGRPVTNLRITSHEGLLEEEQMEGYQRAGLSTGPLVKLSVPVSRSVECECLKVAGPCLVEYLPTVEVLCLHSEIGTLINGKWVRC